MSQSLSCLCTYGVPFAVEFFFLGQMKTSPDVGLILCVSHTFIQDVPDDSYVVV